MAMKILYSNLFQKYLSWNLILGPLSHQTYGLSWLDYVVNFWVSPRVFFDDRFQNISFNCFQLFHFPILNVQLLNSKVSLIFQNDILCFVYGGYQVGLSWVRAYVQDARRIGSLFDLFDLQILILQVDLFILNWLQAEVCVVHLIWNLKLAFFEITRIYLLGLKRNHVLCFFKEALHPLLKARMGGLNLAFVKKFFDLGFLSLFVRYLRLAHLIRRLNID